MGKALRETGEGRRIVPGPGHQMKTIHIQALAARLERRLGNKLEAMNEKHTSEDGQRTGETLPDGVPQRAVDRFERLTDKSGGPESCWMFSGSDRFEVKKLWQLEPRRFAWLLVHGFVPPKECKLYNRCGTKKCVNPAHLWHPTPEERFWAKVQKTDGCWLWTGRVNRGYGGFFPTDREHVRAHRYSWMLVNGPIQDDLRVMHKCDNPLCVRPDHLMLGTDKDNHDDKVRKGRMSTGERHSLAVKQAKARRREVAEDPLAAELKRVREIARQALDMVPYAILREQLKAELESSGDPKESG